MKTCGICGHEYKSRDCSKCAYKRVKAWRIANKERYAKYSTAYSKRRHKEHPERSKELYWKYRDYFVQYQLKNKERIRARKKIYSAENKVRELARVKEYYLLHREERQAYYRNWRKNNPDIDRHHTHKRRMKKKEIGGTHTLKEWKDLCELYGGRCAICGLTGVMTKDHIIPISKGGDDSINNIQPVHRKCNCIKHAKLDFPVVLSRENVGK